MPCEVLVYPLEVDEVADKWKENRQRDRKWVSPHEASQHGQRTRPFRADHGLLREPAPIRVKP